MNRRRFLATSAAVLSAAAARRLPGASRVPAWRVGLQLSSVRDALARDPDRTLAAVAAIGYAEVELFSPYLSSGRAPRETRAALDRAGLAAVATHVGTNLLYRAWERHVAAARALGCRSVVCATPAPEERRSARDWHELAAVFNRAGEAARAAGLRFGYHVGGVEFARVEDVLPSDVLLAETDQALVGFDLDLAGALRSGADPLALLARAPGRVFALHVGDPATVRDALGRVLGPARAGGVEHLIIERDAGPAADQVARARQSYQELRRLAP